MHAKKELEAIIKNPKSTKRAKELACEKLKQLKDRQAINKQWDTK